MEEPDFASFRRAIVELKHPGSAPPEDAVDDPVQYYQSARESLGSSKDSGAHTERPRPTRRGSPAPSPRVAATPKREVSRAQARTRKVSDHPPNRAGKIVVVTMLVGAVAAVLAYLIG